MSGTPQNTLSPEGEQIRGPLVRECGMSQDGVPLHTYEALVSQDGTPAREMLHGSIAALFQMAINFAERHECCVREYELIVNATQVTLEAYYHQKGMLPDVTDELARYLVYVKGKRPDAQIHPPARAA